MITTTVTAPESITAAVTAAVREAIEVAGDQGGPITLDVGANPDGITLAVQAARPDVAGHIGETARAAARWAESTAHLGAADSWSRATAHLGRAS